MLLTRDEKKALYAFGCPNQAATIERMQTIGMIASDPRAKLFFHNLAYELTTGDAEFFRKLYRDTRQEMEATDFRGRKYMP